MYGGGNACFSKSFLQGFAVRDLDGVLGPGAGVVGFDVGGLDGGNGLPRFARNDRGGGLPRFARNDRGCGLPRFARNDVAQ